MSGPDDIFSTPEEVEHWITTTLSRLDSSEEILDCPPVEGGLCSDCDYERKVRRHLGRFDLCRKCLLSRLTVAKLLELPEFISLKEPPTPPRWVRPILTIP